MRRIMKYMLQPVAIGTIAWVSTLPFGISAHAALKESESTYREFRSEVVLPVEQPQVLVVRQELAEFLALAGEINGYRVTFSNAVSGVVENTSLPMNMHALMDRIGKAFGLKWHIGSGRLFISSGSKPDERVLELKGLEFDVLQQAIARNGINKSEYEMKLLQNRNAVILVGPASYLDGIDLIAAELNGSVNSNE